MKISSQLFFCLDSQPETDLEKRMAEILKKNNPHLEEVEVC